TLFELGAPVTAAILPADSGNLRCSPGPGGLRNSLTVFDTRTVSWPVPESRIAPTLWFDSARPNSRDRPATARRLPGAPTSNTVSSTADICVRAGRVSPIPPPSPSQLSLIREGHLCREE